MENQENFSISQYWTKGSGEGTKYEVSSIENGVEVRRVVLTKFYEHGSYFIGAVRYLMNDTGVFAQELDKKIIVTGRDESEAIVNSHGLALMVSKNSDISFSELGIDGENRNLRDRGRPNKNS